MTGEARSQPRDIHVLAETIDEVVPVALQPSEHFRARLTLGLSSPEAFKIDVALRNDEVVPRHDKETWWGAASVYDFAAKRPGAIVTVANLDALLLAALKEDRSPIVVVDVSQDNIDALQWLCRESLAFDDVKQWRDSVLLLGRGDSQKRGLVHRRRLAEALEVFDQDKFERLKATLRDERLHFLVRDWKSTGLGEEVALITGEVVSLVNVSNIPEYLRGGIYATESNERSNPTLFHDNVRRLVVGDARLLYGMAYDRVRLFRGLHEAQEVLGPPKPAEP